MRAQIGLWHSLAMSGTITPHAVPSTDTHLTALMGRAYHGYDLENVIRLRILI